MEFKTPDVISAVIACYMTENVSSAPIHGVLATLLSANLGPGQG